MPPVYVKKDVKRTRTDAGFLMDGRRPIKIRKEDNYFPPRSLFDRPSPALAKLRRDLKAQRDRGNFKPLIQITTIKQQLMQPQIGAHLQVMLILLQCNEYICTDCKIFRKSSATIQDWILQNSSK